MSNEAEADGNPKELLDTMLGYLGFVVQIEETLSEGGNPTLQIYTEEADRLIGRDLVAQQVRLHGYREVDRLVVSHADSDHAGGMAGLLSSLPVRSLLSGNAEILRKRAEDRLTAMGAP